MTCPYEYALGRFNCSMLPARLSATSAQELALAMSATPKDQFYALSTVYAIGNDANGLIKIGYADNLKHRFSGLNSGSPVALKLIHFVHVVDGVVAKRIEGQAHSLLADRRRKGEWFEVTPKEAGTAIGQALTSSGARWWTEYERRKLQKYVHGIVARHEQHQRIFGA